MSKSLNNKKITCLGGGNAMPKAVLEGLKRYPVKISAISAMLDSGGSAGKERKDYKTRISFGDFRRAALALAKIEPKNKERFAYRYKSGPLAGHVVANLYCSAGNMAASANIGRSIAELIDEIRDDLNISARHKIVPATLDDSHLAAELEDGTTILGEGNIDVPSHNGKLKIKNVFLLPRAKAYPKALREIKEADLIVIGPGDIYSSISQILLVEGIAEAIRKSSAKKVYICNTMTKYGETNDFSVSDFAKEIEKMLGAELDFVVYNTAFPEKETLRKCRRKHKELLTPVSFAKNLPKNKFVGRKLLAKGTVEHDHQKISKVLISLL